MIKKPMKLGYEGMLVSRVTDAGEARGHERLAPVNKVRDKKSKARGHVVEGLVGRTDHIAHIQVIGRTWHQRKTDMGAGCLLQKVAHARKLADVFHERLATRHAGKLLEARDITWRPRRLVANDPQANATPEVPHGRDGSFREAVGGDAAVVMDNQR